MIREHATISWPRSRRLLLAGLLTALGGGAGCGGGEAGQRDGGGGPVDGAEAGATAYVIAGGGTTVALYRIDPGSGALVFQSEAPAGDDAYVAELDRRRRRLYVLTTLGIPLAIRAFAIDTNGGLLRPAGDTMLPHPSVEGVTQLLIHPTAPWLLASATGGATGLRDQLMPVADDGGLGAPRTVATEYYGFAWDPSGKFFLGLDGVAIGQFTFDPTAGAITANDPLQAEGSFGHQMLALCNHPGGRWIYSVEESTLGLFAFDAATGRLRNQRYLGNPLPGEKIYWTSAVAHASGRFLYVLGYLTGTLIGFVDLFAVDPGSGELTFVAREKGDELHRVQLGSLQAPLLLDDLLVVGGQAMAGRLAGAPVLVVYRAGAADGRLAALGEPTPLGRTATAAVNFLFAVPGK
jgi:6-phosphogluconolactonase (cycloisomerase 2 family)